MLNYAKLSLNIQNDAFLMLNFFCITQAWNNSTQIEQVSQQQRSVQEHTHTLVKMRSVVAVHIKVGNQEAGTQVAGNGNGNSNMPQGSSSYKRRSRSCISAISESNMKKRRRLNTKTTKTLLVISTAFLVLNGPIAVSKLHYLISHESFSSLDDGDSFLTAPHSQPSGYYSRDIELNEEERALFYRISRTRANNDSFDTYLNLTDTNAQADASSTVEKLLNIVTNNVYFLNFVLNFFLYSMNGSKFRDVFFDLFRDKKNRLVALLIRKARGVTITS